MRWTRTILLIAVASSWACRHTKPGTHVEVIDKGGTRVYFAGAAGPGISRTVACKHAVGRSVAAIALRFAQDNEDIAEDIAEAVGASDGEIFMQRYAKATALDSAVHDLKFDPIEHICMGTVSWTPPIFVKDAVMKYAEKLKAQELGGGSSSAPAAPPGSTAAAPSAGPQRAPSTPPPAAASVAPPAASGPVVPACKSSRSKLKKILRSNQKAIDDLAECKRRTGGDETICHRYVLYVEEAKKKEAAGGTKLAACLNETLSSSLRRALGDALPGHGAVSVETRADGTLILWTFSPVDQTAFAFEVAPDGSAAGRSPLAANQVQWVRQQLGL